MLNRTQTHISTVSKAFQGVRGNWRDYMALTKPRVVSLLLLTTLSAMLIAGETLPPPATIGLTLLGGYLAAGGAGALNCYLDRDIDRVMYRTRRRPLPAERLRPEQALYFGLMLSFAAFIILAVGVNLLAAGLAVGGIIYYVLIYTKWLKRRSPENIVIGGGAGAIPPLVGWAAATGKLAPLAFFLFAIIFFWTPPHFWALALILHKEYKLAGIPMHPVVYGERATRTHIVLYSFPLVILTLLPVVFGYLGPYFATVALLFGSLFIYSAVQVRRRFNLKNAWWLYKYSLIYLAVLFVAMVADRIL